MALRYLDPQEQRATEMAAKVVQAYVLSNGDDLSPVVRRKLQDRARAVKLWAEVREWGEAATVVKMLHNEISDTAVKRVLKKAHATLNKQVAQP